VTVPLPTRNFLPSGHHSGALCICEQLARSQTDASRFNMARARSLRLCEDRGEAKSAGSLQGAAGPLPRSRTRPRPLGPYSSCWCLDRQHINNSALPWALVMQLTARLHNPHQTARIDPGRIEAVEFLHYDRPRRRKTQARIRLIRKKAPKPASCRRRRWSAERLTLGFACRRTSSRSRGTARRRAGKWKLSRVRP
jgi:hypothetical protein